MKYLVKNKLIMLALFLVNSLGLFSQSMTTLPSWYEANRAHAHSAVLWRRGSDQTGNRNLFKYLPDTFDSYGVKVFARHIKSNGADGAIWCSAVGKNEPFINCNTSTPNDLILQQINRAHANNQKIGLYYKHNFDTTFARNHPDWICKDFNGDTIYGAGHPVYDYFLCQNSPFRDSLKVRMFEIAQKGADYIYFDYIHNPNTGCWCSYCQQKYIAWSSGDILPNVFSHPKVVNFYNYTVEQFVKSMVDTIHAGNPNCVVLLSVSRASQLSIDQMNCGLGRYADVLKTEIRQAISPFAKRLFSSNINSNSTFSLKHYRIPDDIKLGAGFSILRDASNGKPPHVWINPVCSKDQVNQILGMGYTYGFINNYMFIDNVNSMVTPYMYKEAYQIDSKIGPSLAYKRPVKGIAILHSDIAKDKRLQDLTFTDVRDREKSAFTHVLFPLYWAYSSLTKFNTNTKNYRYPVSFIMDWNLENNQLSDYSTIIVPETINLTATQKNNLLLFKINGGHVIEMETINNQQWFDTTLTNNQIITKQREITDSVLNHTKPEIYIECNATTTDKLNVGFFKNNNGSEYVVNIINDYEWALTDDCDTWQQPNPLPINIDSADVVIKLKVNPNFLCENDVIAYSVKDSINLAVFTSTINPLEIEVPVNKIYNWNVVKIIINPKTGVLPLTMSNNVLYNQTAANSYQWYNCYSNSLIAGASNYSFAPTNSGNYASILTYTNGCKDTTACVNYTLSVATQINDIKNNNDISIYPNPAKNTLLIEALDVFTGIKIVDVLGNEIMTKRKLNTKNYNLDISTLNTGTYLVEISTNSRTFIKKIVKE